jgi:hypothetical protein
VSIEVSNPQTRRVNNRRKNLNKTWSGKAWKEARIGFIESHGGKCEWCGSSEHLTVHHPMRNSYGPDVYLDFALSECVLLCRSCHAALHNGRVLCTREHPDGLNHYKWHDADMCGYCYLLEHPEIKEKKAVAKREQARNRRSLNHPCSRRGKEQKCRRKAGVICQYTPKKAEGCDYFIAKGARA